MVASLVATLLLGAVTAQGSPSGESTPLAESAESRPVTETDAPLSTHATAGPEVFQRALADINARYRRPLGLRDLVWDPLLAKAAQNHADYYALNKTFSAHDETPGRPGFTGATPEARCAAVGYPGFCGEDAHSATGIAPSRPRTGCAPHEPYGRIGGLRSEARQDYPPPL